MGVGSSLCKGKGASPGTLLSGEEQCSKHHGRVHLVSATGLTPALGPGLAYLILRAV